MNKTDSSQHKGSSEQPPSINVEGVDDRRQRDGVTLEEDFGWVPVQSDSATS
jgi:hypothetical protein